MNLSAVLADAGRGLDRQSWALDAGLNLNLLLLEKCQSVGDALLRISRGDVVRVAADHHQS